MNLLLLELTQRNSPWTQHQRHRSVLTLSQSTRTEATNFNILDGSFRFKLVSDASIEADPNRRASKMKVIMRAVRDENPTVYKVIRTFGVIGSLSLFYASWAFDLYSIVVMTNDGRHERERERERETDRPTDCEEENRVMGLQSPNQKSQAQNMLKS